MDFNNFNNQEFNELPSLVVGSNFENCTFNAESKFERCNIRNCKFTKNQYFYLSNVINCEGADDSTFDKSNNIKEEEEDLLHRFEEDR